jgi:VanZ family protein
MKIWLRRWGPAILVMMLIFIASATPGSDLPKFGAWDLLSKKGGHMCGYALLASAFFHALERQKQPARSRFLLPIVLACLYAATDEFHQRFTPGRTASLLDVGIDALGAILGLSVWAQVSKLWKRRRSDVNPGS